MYESLVAGALLALSCGLGQTPPEMIVHAADGIHPAAPLVDMANDFTIKLGGKRPLEISGAGLISMRRAGATQPARCPPPFLELTTGDRLPLAIPIRVQLDDESVHANLGAPLTVEKISVPQAAVALIALTSATEPTGKRTQDLVVLKNGDALAGKLGGFDSAKGAKLVVSGQTTLVPLDKIAQISFNPDFQARPRTKATYADVVLAGGSRLSLSKVTMSKGQLSAATLFGQRVSFAAADLVALRVRNGKAVYLDELKPKAYEAIPFLDVAWPMTTGRTLLGAPLKVGDDFYPLGLGMHSRSQATFDLNQGFGWFEATVAVDAAAGPQAVVRVDVQLDGKPADGAARLLKVGDAPAVLRIDTRGVKTLTLVTDFGPRGDVQGHAIWADARLIRK
jgi:hypothetical protein